MKLVQTLLRIFFTIIFLILLVHFVSLKEIFQTIAKCDLSLLIVSASIMPFFIAARISKWFLLTRQVAENVTLPKIGPGYLWGMALGLITPGRLGELARIQGMGQPGKYTGLFFLEKIIEVACLLGICLTAIVTLNFLAWWMAALLMLMLIICAVAWRKILIVSLRLSGKIFGWPSREKLEKIEWAILNLKVGSNFLLSTACFFLFTTQIYLILLGMGVPSDLLIVPLIPLVLLTNLVPITIGGYGIRESVAVLIFKFKHIESVVAASSVGLAVFFDLVVPGLIGAGIHLFQLKKKEPN